MFFLPHVLIRLPRFPHPKHAPVHHRLQATGIHRLVHRFELRSTPHHHPAHRARPAQTLQERGLVLLTHPAQEANDADDAFRPHCAQGLRHSGGTADFDHVMHTRLTGGEVLGRVAPVRVRGVVQDMVGAEPG